MVDGDLYLFFFPVDIIRFGERSDFLIFGGLSKNFALIVNSIIFSIDDCRSVLNSLFAFIVCFKNICLRRLLKYLHLYIIWKDVSRQFVSQSGSHSFITSVQ